MKIAVVSIVMSNYALKIPLTINEFNAIYVNFTFNLGWACMNFPFEVLMEDATHSACPTSMVPSQLGLKLIYSYLHNDSLYMVYVTWFSG